MAEFELDDDDDDLVDEGVDDVEVPALRGVSPKRSRRGLIIGLVLGAVVLAVGLVFGSRFLFSPKPLTPGLSSGAITSQELQANKKKKKKKKIKYVKLYDLTSEAVGDVLRELSFEGITFQTEQRGKNFTLSVDEDELEQARTLLAIKGLPAGGAKGYALLDNSQTLGVTEFDKRIRFIRALSGELEKAIIQFDMIENAKVQIVLPEQRLFSVTQPPVTASILIRRVYGAVITDDTVFGIIQLVANAVENLQQENVSVIDTEGKVLSNGLFERMALREAGITPPPEKEYVKEAEVEKEIVESISDVGGRPVEPNPEEIARWYNLKLKYEENLASKVRKQLVGVLPLGSFKVAVSSELGPLSSGEIVDIRRLSVSIVVDNSRDDLFLDQPLKTEIFNTVAAAIGYQRGRGDTIQLSTADFALLTQEERDKLAQSPKSILDYVLMGLGGLAGLLVVFGVVRAWRRRRKKKSSGLNNNSRGETNFSELKEEVASERHINELKTLADRDPNSIAKLLESWVRGE